MCLFPTDCGNCRYDSIVKALNTSNETVLALGANFSHSADSHLVAMQVNAFIMYLSLHSISWFGAPKNPFWCSFKQILDIPSKTEYTLIKKRCSDTGGTTVFVLLRGRTVAIKHKQSIYRTRNGWSLEQGINNVSVPQMTSPFQLCGVQWRPEIYSKFNGKEFHCRRWAYGSGIY